MTRYPIATGKPRMSHGTCRGCGAQMWWVMTKNGRKMPLDPDVDHERGNVVLRASDNRAVAFGSPQEAKDWVFVHDGDGPYTTHFATCPARNLQREEHR